MPVHNFRGISARKTGNAESRSRCIAHLARISYWVCTASILAWPSDCYANRTKVKQRVVFAVSQCSRARWLDSTKVSIRSSTNNITPESADLFVFKPPFPSPMANIPSGVFISKFRQLMKTHLQSCFAEYRNATNIATSALTASYRYLHFYLPTKTGYLERSSEIPDSGVTKAVSYTHLTLPTNREV